MHEKDVRAILASLRDAFRKEADLESGKLIIWKPIRERIMGSLQEMLETHEVSLPTSYEPSHGIGAVLTGPHTLQVRLGSEGELLHSHISFEGGKIASYQWDKAGKEKGYLIKATQILRLLEDWRAEGKIRYTAADLRDVLKRPMSDRHYWLRLHIPAITVAESRGKLGNVYQLSADQIIFEESNDQCSAPVWEEEGDEE